MALRPDSCACLLGALACALAACRPTATREAARPVVAPEPPPAVAPSAAVPPSPCAGAPAVSRAALTTLFDEVWHAADAGARLAGLRCLADFAVATADAARAEGCDSIGAGLGSCDRAPFVVAAGRFVWAGHGWNTYRLDTATGELELVLAGASLAPGPPGARLLVAADPVADGSWLVHPEREAALLTFGPTTVLWPEGPLVYAARAGCGWDLWDASIGELAAALDPPAELTGCEHGDDTAFVTADGRWLVGALGVWDVAARRYLYRPGGYAHVVSGDRRWLVYLERDGDSGLTYARSRLVVRELATGQVRGRSEPTLGPLSNGEPIELSADGRTVTVVDYAVSPFAMPTLRPLAPWVTGRGAEHHPRATPPPDVLAESRVSTARAERAPAATSDDGARATLAAAVCHAGEWLLPRAACQGPR
ncbi:MAG: hypothetical protein IT373_33300 [Polyangiaceae bacterium]|nr:hypothetical protein [Polyangiaceae bacterium]